MDLHHLLLAGLAAHYVNFPFFLTFMARQSKCRQLVTTTRHTHPEVGLTLKDRYHGSRLRILILLS
jgi:hypothetical protein